MVTIGNAHEDLIHDAVLDYYGKRLATSSSDKTIKIFEVENDEHKLVETLRGHEGPVWQVSWAHPKFGVILASASYDGKVFIWKEENGKWSIISQHSVHQASVNSVSWAPHEYGAQLLVASSDGKISIVEYKEDGTTSSIVIERAHAIGVNSATWAPPVSAGSSIENDKSKSLQERRFASGGSDNLVKIWKFNPEVNTYELEHTLEGHTDWVRDVAWSPSVLARSYIASASQDRTVIIWSQDKPGANWSKQYLTEEKFPDVVWRANWSLSGNILAVSGGDNKVTLWRESLDGRWESAGQIDE
ncbi:hypothetical protein WICMUC_001886 [Wickerhamomyces mucosus]|uniref:Protein transport protein SEC13 n=1 Tax=Wickerhamomyces mucosus TaxID=1378264 RepID=A0A9P8TFM9_9ASCO|nr:hypothetical protein WICMUC_001886 [Wickerhamomyces mucosus]